MLHLLRVGLFVAILWLIHHKHSVWRSRQAYLHAGTIPIERVQKFFPTAVRLGGWDSVHRAQFVIDSSGDVLGFAVQTAPASDQVVGYAGPTDVLIAFDRDSRVVGIDILESRDTREHVEDVRNDVQFMHAYDRLDWQAAAEHRDVEGVTGATLTSLAIVESISARLGHPCPSIRFPQALGVDELKRVWPRATKLERAAQQHLVWNVFDAKGQLLGGVVRTSPTCDALAGYQGPTDTLIFLDPQQHVLRIAIRSSYDNEPYVRYVREDEYFCTLFNHLKLNELAKLDLEAAEVEGVSGATMTSMAVARSLTQAAAAATVRKQPARSVIFSARDAGTCIILALGMLMSFSHLRGSRRLRFIWRLTLVGYLGFMNGDMLSQVLLVGWAQSGIPWRLAPGLVLLSCAAVLVPMASRRPLYCHHICPFGAVQQLIAHRSKQRWKLSRRVRLALSLIAPALLLWVVLTGTLHLPIDLANVEPFDAFAFWIAGAMTLAIAAVGLVGAWFWPMAYCRFGCPTGTLLDYIRFRTASDRLTRRNLAAAVLLLVAWIL